MKQGKMNWRKTIDGKKTALTVGISNEIERAIDRACARYIGTMLSWDKPAWWFVERAFDEAVLQGCREGYKYSKEKTFVAEYLLGADVIRIREWKAWKMLAPDAEYMHVTDTIPELMTYCLQVREIIAQFARVRHVFNWLNRSCWGGEAICNYAPWVRSCVNSFPVSNYVRLKEPDRLAPMLSLIREAATTMATAMLIHDDPEGRSKHRFELQFKAHTQVVNGLLIQIPFYTDIP